MINHFSLFTVSMLIHGKVSKSETQFRLRETLTNFCNFPLIYCSHQILNQKQEETFELYNRAALL